jgi:glycosyltransferase involved in cell wall biosynthesis/CDP-glycerol glycerophosphotransferase (TagB/SpsB family)
MPMKESYAFSVVTAVYNVEPFLPKTYQSLLRQEFGFSNVQWILCDDGSTDGSLALCESYAKQYPDNILVLHQENKGVSTARNACLAHVRGKYVSFLDADDLLGKNVLTKVFAFFEAHPETDVVSLPMVFFDGKKGRHRLNYKFKQGTRVIDLEQEPNNPQLAVTSAFVRADALVGRSFDPDLSYAEDARFLQSILLEKKTLGVVADVKHYYRRRRTGAASAIQNAGNTAAWYLPYLEHFCKATLDDCEARFGTVPRFVQYTIAYDLQYRICQRKIPFTVLDEESKTAYHTLLFSLLRRIDDDILLQQEQLQRYHRAFLLHCKYGDALKVTAGEETWLCQVGDGEPVPLAYEPIACDFCRIENGVITLECSMISVHGFDRQIPPVAVEADGVVYTSEPIDRQQPLFSMGQEIARRYGYEFHIPLPKKRKPLHVRFCLNTEDGPVPYDRFVMRKFFPVTDKYAQSYAKIGDRILTYGKGELCFAPAFGRTLWRELRFLGELLKKGKREERHAIVGRLAYAAARPFFRKPIWLVSDRQNVAGDNGEALFRYLREQKKKPMRLYFVISEDSPDYAEMKKVGRVVKSGSFRHKLLFLLTDLNVSSHADEATVTPFTRYDYAYRDIENRIRFVFLQHGVIKDDLSGWLNRFNRNFTAFVTSAKAEADSIRTYPYLYPDDAIWLTGLPRFDRLYHDEKRCITIMPTWRRFLATDNDIHVLKDGFEDSAFYRFYTTLMRDERLIAAAKRTGYTIRFLPHPMLQPHIDRFPETKDVEILPAGTPYRQVIAETDLMLTDYSSVAFDFVYLRKPILYTQFDRDEFHAGHSYVEGYFDYERDGFGEVETDYDATVDRLIEYMENDCRLKDKYRARINGFLAYDDQNNCRRVYERMLALDAKGRRPR